jgi:Fe-S-cluster containining protein
VSRTRSQADAALAALYARIPDIPDCDGRCWTSCGPIDMSWRERARIREAGVKITPWEDAKAWRDTFWCEALTEGKRCAVYEMRPLVCRLWGAAEGLECPFGCIPEGGWLSRAEAYELIAESMRIGGHAHASDDPAQVHAALARREVREELDRLRDRGRAGDALRAAHAVPAAFRRAGADGH